MTPLFKKLNYKNHPTVHIINAPDSFQTEMDAMQAHTDIIEELDNNPVLFSLAFATTKDQIDDISNSIDKWIQADGIVWFAYPKKSSKKYSVDISRDYGWDNLGKLGYEGVRAVSIDTDWSALRFRKAEYIKTMKRDASWAMSKIGKEKANKK